MNSGIKIPILLAMAAALLTIVLKFTASWLTGSVGLLSDAMESIINLVASVTAYWSLWYAARPVDASHTYGHQKIEFFSSGIEGVLILAAAFGIAWLAIGRLFQPVAPQSLDLGLGLALVASLVNGAVGILLLRAGKKHHSIVLEADGKHLLTDVWTSVAVLVGLGLVALTGKPFLDPLVALLVAANICWTAWNLILRSFNGLMDHALPAEEQELIRRLIRENLDPGMDYHAVRTRQAGARRFLDFHLLVPGHWSVSQAHDRTGLIETALHRGLPGLEVTVHVEPFEHQQSWEDSALLPLEQRERIRRGEEPMPGVSSEGLKH